MVDHIHLWDGDMRGRDIVVHMDRVLLLCLWLCGLEQIISCLHNPYISILSADTGLGSLPISVALFCMLESPWGLKHNPNVTACHLWWHRFIWGFDQPMLMLLLLCCWHHFHVVRTPYVWQVLKRSWRSLSPSLSWGQCLSLELVGKRLTKQYHLLPKTAWYSCLSGWTWHMDFLSFAAQ